MAHQEHFEAVIQQRDALEAENARLNELLGEAHEALEIVHRKLEVESAGGHRAFTELMKSDVIMRGIAQALNLPPEASAEQVLETVREAAKDRDRLNWLAEMSEGIQSVFIEPCGWMQLSRGSIDAAITEAKERE